MTKFARLFAAIIILAVALPSAGRGPLRSSDGGIERFPNDVFVAGNITATGTVTGSGGGLTLENGESLNTGTDAVFDFTRDDAGTVTILCSDNDATCAIIYDAGGAAAVTVGSIDVTQLMCIVDNDMVLRNGATGSVSFDFRDYADTTDDDMAHGIITVNCTDTGTGAEDCDLTIAVVEGGAAAETRFSIDADGGITIGSANTNSITVTTDDTGDGTDLVLPAQGVDGSEIKNDDVDGAQLKDTVDLDADLTWTVGAAEQFIWNKTATDAAGDYGAVFNYLASDTTAATVGQIAFSLTNSASTEAADVMLEIDNSDADDNVGTAILIANPTRFDAHFSTGNAAVVMGIATTDSWTFTADGTGTGEFVVPAESIAADEITNLTRAVPVAIFSLIDCTTAGAAIGFDATADALPDFAISGTDGLGGPLAWDDTGGSEDTGMVCGVIQVPPDYVSGGVFVLRVGKDAETAGATEVLNVQISNDGAALEAAGTATVTASAVANYTVTPTIAGIAAGESLGFALYVTSATTIDDTVNVYSLDFQYTATQ